MKRRIYLLNSIAAALLLSGCTGYRLGGGKPAGIETVAVAPVINKSGEPAIELQVTHAMRERVQYDGRLTLANKPEHADGTIEVTLSNYKLQPIAYDKDLQTTPNIYRLRITAVADLKNSAGEVISSSKTYGEATFEFKSDLTSSKRDALPRAADELARFILDDLIEQW